MNGMSFGIHESLFISTIHRVTNIVKNVIRAFVLHMSIAKPLSESGKLQLTTDMTEFEFALSAFMADKTAHSKRGADWESVGPDYRALRAMRCVLTFAVFCGFAYGRRRVLTSGVRSQTASLP